MLKKIINKLNNICTHRNINSIYVVNTVLNRHNGIVVYNWIQM